ncbi:MAG: hypothetical protein DA408_15225 [Bacteroidetes bacterium]|nr:MAG: hypothetical protein C7N36_04595 [Bacteroidota bacterium]PTM10745.1 MAG: hypothetical protein DA408_15225 [Bacteroidota bacterium]
MQLKLPFLALCLGLATVISAQDGGTYYGIKGGLTIGTQQWNTFDRDPLIGYHTILTVESLPVEDKFSLFAQVGYHLKGSAIRRSLFGNPFNANLVSFPPQKFEFHNISLSVGAKQVFGEVNKSKLYYLFGIRGDYTMGTNLDEYEIFVERNPNFAGIYPLNIYYSGETLLGVRRLNYGFLAGGGITLPFSEFVEGLLEFTVNPDFSLQYEQPSIPNVVDPFSGQTRSIPERKIRNLTFEITVGFRFLKKVEYID